MAPTKFPRKRDGETIYEFIISVIPVKEAGLMLCYHEKG